MYAACAPTYHAKMTTITDAAATPNVVSHCTGFGVAASVMSIIPVCVVSSDVVTILALQWNRHIGPML